MKINYPELARLYNIGESYADMALAFGCKKSSIGRVIILLKKRGIIVRRKIDNAKQGENSSRAKLSNQNVKKIIVDLLNGSSSLDLSKEYNVHIDTIRAIAKGRSWMRLFSDGENNEILELTKRK
jgi:hypothetical protein